MTEKTVEIMINGMTCGHCASRVKDSLEDVQGVKEANVDLGGKKATVQFDDEKADVENLKKAISDAGYNPV